MNECDQETLKQLLQHGAVLMIAGVPKGTEFGINLSSYSVDNKFQGIKMIPEGPHFIYTSAKGTFNETGSRVGYMSYFNRGEVQFRDWDSEKEELVERIRNNDDYEERYIKDNIRTFDKVLAPYDYETLRKWRGLTHFVKDTTIKRLSPDEGIIRTSIEFMPCTDEDRPRGAKLDDSVRSMKIKSLADEDLLLPKLKAIPETEFKFTKLSDRHPADASPAEISLSYLDSIDAVTSLLESRESEIIEEIQYSFAIFLCGYSVDGLDHWRRILGLLCNSETAILKYKSFYQTYILILINQLPELPIEVMEPGPHNTIFQDVKKFVRNCYDTGLIAEMKEFQEKIYSQMLWSFDNILEDDPEDMPVIVE